MEPICECPICGEPLDEKGQAVLARIIKSADEAEKAVGPDLGPMTREERRKVLFGQD